MSTNEEDEVTDDAPTEEYRERKQKKKIARHWTWEEKRKLVELIEQLGEKDSWSFIARMLNKKSGAVCARCWSAIVPHELRRSRDLRAKIEAARRGLGCSGEEEKKKSALHINALPREILELIFLANRGELLLYENIRHVTAVCKRWRTVMLETAIPRSLASKLDQERDVWYRTWLKSCRASRLDAARKILRHFAEVNRFI